MTIQWGDTGRVVFGTQKTFNISVAVPRETLLGSPVSSLPTVNPGSPQITYTIQQSDLPTISPTPFGVTYTAIFVAGGKNTDAASQSISYQAYKNGVAISGATGSSTVATNTFWTQSHYRFFNVSVGDVIGVSLWSASVNMNYDYYALMVFPTQLALSKNNTILSNFVLGSSISPSLASGTPSVQSTGGYNLYPCSSNTTNISFNQNVVGLTASQTLPVFMHSTTTYNAGKVQNGDVSLSTAVNTHATYRPYYARNYIPSSISFREILR